jgi:hypothetical protein
MKGVQKGSDRTSEVDGDGHENTSELLNRRKESRASEHAEKGKSRGESIGERRNGIQQLSFRDAQVNVQARGEHVK